MKFQAIKANYPELNYLKVVASTPEPI